MPRYSVAEAKNRFAELLKRAEAGEEVEVTRRGEVVAQLVPKKPKAMRFDPDWFAARGLPIRPEKPFDESWADLIRKMRDEEDGY